MIHLAPLLGAENALFKTIGEIFHPLFVAIAYVLAAIYGVIPNYAVAIAVLTVIIMALLTPLTVKSTKSMTKMQALQPEMQKLRQKYKGAQNREQLNQEMMRLYREHGVSPTGGCLPMFLQMPALIVLYDIIEGLANTVTRGEKLATNHLVCHQAVCAVPRYIPHNSAMYHDLIKTPGVMESFGVNFAAKPFTHHGAWYAYVPYFIFVVLAVGLQYFQMAQMTKRNRGQTTTPSQMQTMQRVMPLVFAYIYFIVPAGVVVYMIVSSAIRLVTQDIIFRYGMVERPGERRIGGPEKSAPPGGILGRVSAAIAPPRPTDGDGSGDEGAGTGGAAPERGAAPKGGAPKGGAPKGGTGQAPSKPAGQPRQRPPGGQKGGRAGGRAGANGAVAPNGSGRARGTTGGSTEQTPKPHPRSKSKRARKAR